MAGGEGVSSGLVTGARAAYVPTVSQIHAGRSDSRRKRKAFAAKTLRHQSLVSVEVSKAQRLHLRQVTASSKPWRTTAANRSPTQLEITGLWNKPALVGNVETLAWAKAIVIKGK